MRLDETNQTHPYFIMPLPFTTTGPSFGWQGPQHAALNQGALGSVEDKQFANYLAKNQGTIQWHDNAQDTLHKGPGHFANLDAPSNTSQLGLGADNGKTPWDMLYAVFSPKRQAWLTQQWQGTPLQEADLPTGTTVYDSAIEQFNAALEALTTVHSNGDAQQERITHQNAVQALGALSHYVTDLHMPLHATRFFNWTLAPASAQRPESLATGIHEFVEGELFTADELVQLAQQARLQSPPPLTSATLKPYLRKQLMASYLTSFELFAAQQKVFHQMPQALQQPERYKAQLKQALKPIVAKRYQEGQRTLAAVYNLLWHEAKTAEALRTQPLSTSSLNVSA